MASTCGPSGTGSCCDSPTVGGGTFYRGYDAAVDALYPDTTHAATVSTFRLDKYEVTVGRFRQFVLAGDGTQGHPPVVGAGAHANIANSGWDPTWDGSLAADMTALVAAVKCDPTYQTWTDAPSVNESRPMVCVTWFEATAFCAWDGGFLPTEAEWHYAASGGSLQRAYPWSSPPTDLTVDCAHANFGGASWPTTACVAAGTDNVGATSPVGEGVWGQADLGGNAWEWVLDWYAAGYPNPCTDCANLFPSTVRVLRGGSLYSDVPNLRAANRYFMTPTNRKGSGGVRCARSAS